MPDGANRSQISAPPAARQKSASPAPARAAAVIRSVVDVET
jgi:hypothetical protein